MNRYYNMIFTRMAYERGVRWYAVLCGRGPGLARDLKEINYIKGHWKICGWINRSSLILVWLDFRKFGYTDFFGND